MKKKRGLSTDIIRVDDGRKAIEVEEVVEKQPVQAGVKLLADEEFEKETGGYQSDAEEGEPDKLEDNLPVDDSPEKKTVSKKRKASKKLKRSKYVKQPVIIYLINFVFVIYVVFKLL